MAKQGSPVRNSKLARHLRNPFGRAWRLLGTAIGFMSFGLGGLVIGIFVFPFIFLFVRDADARLIATRRTVGWAFRMFIAIMNGLGVMSYTIEGAEHIKKKQNQLIIANHPTLIDVIFLVSLFPLADCVVKEAVAKNPFMHAVVSSAKYIASDDPIKLLETCVGRLKSGASLVLFPEGTRTVPGRPLKFKAGAAYIATNSGVDILPVSIQCSHPRLLAKYQPWYLVPVDKPLFSLKIYPPIALKSMVPEDLPMRQATRILNAQLVDFFTKAISPD